MFDTVGIIGYGNMGMAIGERLKAGYDLIVFDKDKESLRRLRTLSSPRI